MNCKDIISQVRSTRIGPKYFRGLITNGTFNQTAHLNVFSWKKALHMFFWLLFYNVSFRILCHPYPKLERLELFAYAYLNTAYTSAVERREERLCVREKKIHNYIQKPFQSEWNNFEVFVYATFDWAKKSMHMTVHVYVYLYLHNIVLRLLPHNQLTWRCLFSLRFFISTTFCCLFLVKFSCITYLDDHVLYFCVRRLNSFIKCIPI